MLPYKCCERIDDFFAEGVDDWKVWSIEVNGSYKGLFMC